MMSNVQIKTRRPGYFFDDRVTLPAFFAVESQLLLYDYEHVNRFYAYGYIKLTR